MSDTALDTRTGAALGGYEQATAGVGDFIALLKPRVMSLVVFSGFAGLMLAPGHLHPVLAAVAILCIAVSAGAAGAVNMWYDRDIDAIMTRTQKRPIPAGKVDPDEALAFGVVLSVAPVILMGLAVNWVAAGLLAFASAFYIFVYTMWLKRSTPQNIVIGGAAGAFPPMIGWAAVTGDISLASVVLFALVFFWTPPHFWALALFRRIDYSDAGVPMLPVVAGERETKRQMLAYTVLLFPLALTPYVLGVSGVAYAIGAAVLGGLFLLSAVRVLRAEEGDYKPAKQMFAFSILYLFLLFALMVGERLVLG
ncbi:heme o synthase [Indioceanicola profundi]|uniref:heme o synthase n=1 Tax=Indioceanicola profundi TaxID=2220096 RepID=UPI000E6AE1D1|nr:heme o synthase [Indioceanicola profundi]